MSKRHLHSISQRLSFLPLSLLVGLFAISIVTGILALRHNNTNMLKLRDAVAKADEQNGDIETALRNLREYVYGHMNTNLTSGSNAIRPPIQLKFRYERLVKAEQDRVDALNSKLYTEAQAVCEQQVPQGLSGRGRVPCIQDYITNHGGAQSQPIPDSLYKFDFVSPAWSPDLAGWSLVVAGFSLLLLTIRFGLEGWLKHDLRE